MENQIDTLLAKIISGNASAKELEEFEKWKRFGNENKILFQETKKVWKHNNFYLSEASLQNDKLYLLKEYSKYLNEKANRESRTSFLYKLVAMLSIPVALAISWYIIGINSNQITSSGQLCEIISPQGHISKAVLPDGTEVWINTGSSITYNVASFISNKREVKLSGEAFFEVTHLDDNPFVVTTPHVDIKVTGTSFNVNSYPETSNFEAVLSEGKIQLQFNNQEAELIDLEPNQRFVYNNTTNGYEIQHIDSRVYSSWRNGEIIFKDATLNDLVRELERIYDIKFKMQPANLGELRFRGMFSYNNNLIEALEKIKKTSGIDYYIENKEVKLKKSN